MKSNYSKIKRKAKYNFSCKEKRLLTDMCKYSPRQFWKYISKFRRKGVAQTDIDINSLLDHFSSYGDLSNSVFSCNNFECTPRDELLNIYTLDCPFTVEEITKTISSLKRNKCADLDDNVADFFIDANDLIAPHLCVLFNFIYDTGVYPEKWLKGFIVPIHKKGDKRIALNYRGITIINCMSKIFSLTLRNRLNKWSENTNTLSDAQFGFRDGRSTADAVFILHSIIQKVLSKQSKLWCAFIDYERAFDTVIHKALWLKLMNTGVSCKMVNMLKSMYNNIMSCVRQPANNTMSDFFDISIGLKQGEPLSTILFLLFINDINSCLDTNALTEKDIELLSTNLLLFADDIVLFTTDRLSLQSQLNNIYEYSSKWGLKINISKTKLCIFEKRKQHHDGITINNVQIEKVDEFSYLGVKFKYTGSMTQAIKSNSDQALKAYHNILYLFDKVSFDIKTKLKIFDTMVVPILLYSSEIWGVYNCKEIDKMHIKFCKSLLGVKKQTHTDAVYGELGRYPLSILAKERCLKFFLKILNKHNSPMYSMYIELCNLNTTCWASKVNSVIDHLGY